MTASITPFKPGSSGSDCLKYYEEQLANGGREDYYLQEEGHAEMYGRGLDRLAPDTEAGADDVREFDRKAMMNMLEGKDNAGNEILKSTYRSLDGKESKGRIPGWDITFSPDKSVSVAWAAASPELRKQIEAAHDSAARGALDHIQNHYGLANEGRGGAGRVQADISAGIFRHGASRELEPQLHSHCVIPNMAVKADGKVVSINGGELFRRQKEAGAIYRAELADNLKGLGFDIERKGDNFRLSGVPQDICDQYSTRREQIEAAMDERGTHGAKAAEVAALDTRSAKQGITDSVLLKQWQGEMAEKGFTAESVEALRGREKATDSPASTMPTHEEFLQKLTANNSTFSKNDVWREAAVAAQGVTDRHGAASYAEEFLSTKSPDVLRLQHKENGAIRYTSREMFDLERGMIADAGALRDSTAHQLDSAAVDKAINNFESRKGFSLSTDQRETLEAMTLRGDFVTIQGAGGTGKSTGVEVAADAWRGQGFRVRGLAAEGSAAVRLREANIESNTIASALMKNKPWTDDKGFQRPAADPFTSRDVLVVDEAGKIDSRTMAKLTAAAKESGAKLVLMGDTKQLQPIGAGGAFNAQQNARGGADAELTTIQRQKTEGGKEMVTNVRNGEISEALGYLHERGELHISDDKAGAMRSTLDKWREHYSHARPESAYMLANTNAEVRALNDAARSQLKEEGLLGGHGIETGVEDRNGASLGKREFLEGERVVFGRNAKLSNGAKLTNGDTATIESINLDRNGQHIISVRRDGTDDLVNVPVSEYRAINHAYALTTTKSQGSTADHVSILAGGRMQDLHSTYVQVSRMRHTANVSCSKDAIEAEMMKHEPTDSMRDYAADLAEKNGVELPEGVKDNFRICRDFLNEYGKNKIENGKPVDPWKRDISNLSEAMSKERIKETSLDYNLANEENFVDKSEENFVDKSESEEGSSKDGGQNAGATLPPHKDENDQGESLGSGLVKGVTSALSSQGGENSQIKKDAGKVADSLKTFVNPLSKIPGLGGGLER